LHDSAILNGTEPSAAAYVSRQDMVRLAQGKSGTGMSFAVSRVLADAVDADKDKVD